MKGFHRKGSTFAAVAFAAIAMSVGAQESSLAVIGPLDAAHCRAGAVTILGIEFRARGEEQTSAICARAQELGAQVVAAKGRIDSAGLIHLEQIHAKEGTQYVAGATDIYLRGTISKTDVNSGRFYIQTAVVLTGSVPPSVGSQVEIVGSQPLPGGVLLPKFLVLAEPFASGNIEEFEVSSFSSAGSGKQSSAGSGMLSSAGSGKLSSAGSGMLSSAGSGMLSSAGSGKQSSAGSGMLSSAGSGKMSSAGSGMLSSAGSGKLSSAGSGMLSSAGSGMLSSAGSGTLSSAGSGSTLD